MSLRKEQRYFIQQLYKEMYIPLCIYAMNALNALPLAEEAVQETFRIACEKIICLSSSENPKGWLTNTLKNIICNIKRKRSRADNIVIKSVPVDEMAIASRDNDMYFDIEYSDYREMDDFILLEKIVLEKYTMLEASRELGITVEACKKRVQRGKKKLRKIITENN